MTDTSWISSKLQVSYLNQDDFLHRNVIEAEIHKEPHFKIPDFVWISIPCNRTTVKPHNVLQP